VLLTVLVVLAGIAAGLVTGGRLRNVRRTRVRWPWLLVVAVVLRLAVAVLDLGAPEVVLATSIVVLLVLAGANLHLPGLGVVAIGLLCNLAPLVANGAVPVDGGALVDAGRAAAGAEPTLPPGRVLIGPDTVLAPLGERIPLPELGAVLSFGDLIVLTGLVAAGFRATRRRHSGGVPARVLIEELARPVPRSVDLTTPAPPPIDLDAPAPPDPAGRGRNGRSGVPVGVDLRVPQGWAEPAHH